MRAVLGINCSGFHSSACLFVDNRLQYAICEERLSRLKQDKSFPVRAIRYCCDAAGVSLREVSDSFIGWHPRFYIRRSDHTFADAMQNRGKLSYLALNELAALGEAEIQDVKQFLRWENQRLRIHFVDHHRAHVSNGFFCSGFERADCLVLDGFGEHTCGLAGTIDGGSIDILHQHRTPHSLGLLYAAFTDFLGFRPYSDEWKVMALSSLGDPERFYPFVRSLVRQDSLGFDLDLSYFEFYLFFTRRHFSHKLCEVLGDPVEPGAEPSQRDCDIVAAVQRVVEEVTFSILRELQIRTGGRNLVLAGGFFMNSLLNGKIHERTPYEKIFLGGSPDDSGISIGSALHGLNYELGQESRSELSKNNYFGRAYSNEEVECELKRRKLRFVRVSSVPSVVAEYVHAGKIVGVFQGRSEFGQRALGNRSILADPTRSKIKELVNATVKYRETFRPFAPAVLEERQADVFEAESGQTSYFMERVLRFKSQWRERVPAVVHFDGTGRLQTVSQAVNPVLYQTIAEFERLSGVPLLLNTSLNINGMPLVESPGDAIDCFYQSGLDALFLNDCLLKKEVE